MAVYHWKISAFRILVGCLLLTLLIALILGLIPINSPNESCDCSSSGIQKLENGEKGFGKNGKHRLAVIVPFRDRFEELLEFVPHMTKFLNEQNIHHTIYVINQIDKYRFNRASLINVGFLQSCNESDYIAMHDVDLLPLNPKLNYFYPEHNPFHVASPELHPRYHYKTFVGGILLITNDHFRLVNGMSNKYWGWGMEDDEFYARLKRAGLNITRPTHIETGIHDTFRHIHDRQKRKRDTIRLYNQKDVNRKLDLKSGLSSINYSITGRHLLHIDNSSAIIINVELICNLSVTPWCEFANENKPVQKLNMKKTYEV